MSNKKEMQLKWNVRKKVIKIVIWTVIQLRANTMLQRR